MLIRPSQLMLVVLLLFAAATGLRAVRSDGAAPVAGGEKRGEAGRKTPTADRLPLRDAALREALGKPVDFAGINDTETTFKEVLDLLTRQHDVAFEINLNTLARAGIEGVVDQPISSRVLLPRKQIPLRDLLRQILLGASPSADVVFLVRRTAIEITSADAMREELGIAPEHLLPRLVSEDISKEPLGTVLDRLADAADTTILVDVTVQEKARLPVSARLMNVPLDTAVRLLTNMANLEMKRVDNVLYVSSAEKIKALQQSLMQSESSGAGLGGVAPDPRIR